MTTVQPAPPQPYFGLQPRLEYLFSYNAGLQLPPEAIGPVAEGLRLNVYLTGGAIHGPRVNGRLRPVGADWLTIRDDGMAMLDIRATFETDDGALIYAPYTGVMDLGADGQAAFLRGELPADGTPVRTAPRYQTAHPAYQWLNRLQGIGIGRLYLSEADIRYDVFALR